MGGRFGEIDQGPDVKQLISGLKIKNFFTENLMVVRVLSDDSIDNNHKHKGA